MVTLKKEALQYLEHVRDSKEAEKMYEKEMSRSIDEHIAKQQNLGHHKKMQLLVARENLKNDVNEVCRQQIVEKRKKQDEEKRERVEEVKQLNKVIERMKLDSKYELHLRRQNIETYRNALERQIADQRSRYRQLIADNERELEKNKKTEEQLTELVHNIVDSNETDYNRHPWQKLLATGHWSIPVWDGELQISKFASARGIITIAVVAVTLKKEALQYLEHVRDSKEAEKMYEKEMSRSIDEHIAKQQNLGHHKKMQLLVARENLKNDVNEVCRQQIVEKRKKQDEEKRERVEEVKQLNKVIERMKLDSKYELHLRRQNIETYRNALERQIADQRSRYRQLIADNERELEKNKKTEEQLTELVHNIVDSNETDYNRHPWQKLLATGHWSIPVWDGELQISKFASARGIITIAVVAVIETN
ncbi:unnamed protein product [Schistosoma spindalis]|nr:unnamed protein product [Schistosoma spindale]